MLILKELAHRRALLDTVGVWGSNPHAPTNIINNLAPLTSFPVTPVAIRIKKSDDLPCEPHSLYIVALNKASRAALETPSLPLISPVASIVSKVIEAIAVRSGVHQLTTHTMRHLSLTDLARAGWDIHGTATFAGHRSTRTTLLYIQLSGRELAARFERSMASPTLGAFR